MPETSEPLLLQERPTWSESERFVPRSFVRPFQRFMHAEIGGAVVMLAAAIAALAWANSPWHHAQTSLWQTELSVHLGGLAHIDLTLVGWINDALMAVFFFVVGLEIKRELVHGELRDPRKAALPAIAALGGMVVPAAIFMVFNAGGPGFDGWGIPMATDIAFAVAVVTLVGDRIPSSAKIFLLTLAIADDIGAIVVIAIFYSKGLSFGWLTIAVATFLVVELCKRAHIRAMPVYLALALFAWFAVHESGVHATLAGVVLGLLTPAWSFYDPRNFPDLARRLLDQTGPARHSEDLTVEEYEVNQSRLAELDRLVSETQPPLDRLELKLHTWVAFVIVPLFAFSNAGVRLSSEALDGIATDPVVLGVAMGLVAGKTVGVFVATWIGMRLRLGVLPAGVGLRTVLGLAMTAGIGFTVALFVATLAYGPGSAVTDSAKIGILAGSVIAGLLGYTFLRATPRIPAGDDQLEPTLAA